MKPFWIVLLFAGTMLAAAPIMAQDNSGTAPEGRGSTGWTGGNRGQTGTGNPEAAKGQPFMASGVDLKGPPQQFPPGQTPE
jgi:hypothetical protein